MGFKHACIHSPDVQLERLESTPYSSAARAFPPRSMLGHEHVDAGLADAADTLGAGVGLLEQRDALARGAVYLDGVGGEAG